MLGIMLYVLLVSAVVGVILWAIASCPVGDATLKQIVRIVVIAAFCIWLILVVASILGVGPGIGLVPHWGKP